MGVLAAVGLLAACSSGDDPERGLDAIETPAFEADAGGSSSTTTVGDGTPTSTTTVAGEGPSSPSTTAGGGDGGAPEAPPQRVSFDDPVGDAVGGLDDSPPGWSDRTGAVLERQGNAYRLTVRLGDQVPATRPGAETINVATFFDVDGDGSVDHELWVNLGPEGWGPVFYEGDAAYPGEASNVTVVVDGQELPLLFPDVMLDVPDRLRFSVASEYGALDVIGSDFARRDDAPDDDQAVAFP